MQVTIFKKWTWYALYFDLSNQSDVYLSSEFIVNSKDLMVDRLLNCWKIHHIYFSSDMKCGSVKTLGTSKSSPKGAANKPAISEPREGKRLPG